MLTLLVLIGSFTVFRIISGIPALKNMQYNIKLSHSVDF